MQSYTVLEKRQIVWIWVPREVSGVPTRALPLYPHHGDPPYKFGPAAMWVATTPIGLFGGWFWRR